MWSISSVAINVALHVLFPTIITALALPQCTLMTWPEAQNKSRLSGVTRRRPAAPTHMHTDLLCDRLLRLQTRGSERGVSARFSAKTSCRPDTVGLSTQSLGPSQTITMCIEIEEGGSRWLDTEILGHTVLKQSLLGASRVTLSEQRGVLWFFFCLSFSWSDVPDYSDVLLEE